MINEYIEIFATITIALIGWVLAHKFTSNREREQKRRELTTSVLIESYYILTHEIAQRKLTEERKTKFELVLSKIQLFGSEEQIVIVKDLVESLTNNKGFDLDPLINSLRNSLRQDLKLSKVDLNVSWIRYNKDDLDSIK